MVMDALVRADSFRDEFLALPTEVMEMIFDYMNLNNAAARIQATWRGFTRGMRRFYRDVYFGDFPPVRTQREARRLALQEVGIGGFHGVHRRASWSRG